MNTSGLFGLRINFARDPKYSKTCVKQPLKNRSLMKVENSPLGAFCNTFDLHWAIIGLENQVSIFLRVAVLQRFYCIHDSMNKPKIEFITYFYILL